VLAPIEWLISQAVTIHAAAGLGAAILCASLVGITVTGLDPRSLWLARWLSALVPLALAVSYVFGSIAFLGEFQTVTGPMIATGPQAEIGALAGYLKKRLFLATIVLAVLLALLYDAIDAALVAPSVVETETQDEEPDRTAWHLTLALTAYGIVLTAAILAIEFAGVLISHALRAALMPALAG
jgi:hypothetical protein